MSALTDLFAPHETRRPTPRPVALIASSDPAARAFLTDQLTCDGYRTILASNVAEALDALADEQMDVAVLDLAEDALALLVGLRDRPGAGSGVWVVAVARGDDWQRVRLLEQGADDVVGNPYSYPELLARIETPTRRARRARAHRLTAGPLTIDPTERTLRINERLVPISARELDLLIALATAPGWACTRGQLLDSVWGTHGRSRCLDTTVCRLRAKLAAAGAHDAIVNLRGVGYRLTPPSTP